MPRNGSGVFSPPAGTTATASTTIESAKYNAFVADLTADANAVRPVVAGGTGVSSLPALLTALGAQPLDAALTSISALTTAADRMIYTTASDVYAVATLTAAGRALLDDADAAAQRTTLGLVIGTNVQAYDADLAALAAISGTRGDIIRRGASAWERLAIGTAGQVLVSDGTDVVASSGYVLHVQDQKASGTDGGTFTAGSYVTRTLNTVALNTISGASLASNQITLPAGTYDIAAEAAAFECHGHKLILYNVTDAATALVGISGQTPPSPSVQQTATLRGRVTIAATTIFELRHRCATTRATSGLGKAMSFGDAEIYADVMIRRVG